MKLMRWAVLACLFVLAQGCARGKVILPKPDAPLSQRQAAFDRYAMPPNMSLDELKAWSTYPGAPINQQSVLSEFKSRGLGAQGQISMGLGLAGLATLVWPLSPLPLAWAGSVLWIGAVALPGADAAVERDRSAFNLELAKKLGLGKSTIEALEQRGANALRGPEGFYGFAGFGLGRYVGQDWADYYGYELSNWGVRSSVFDLGLGISWSRAVFFESLLGLESSSGNVTWTDPWGSHLGSQEWWERDFWMGLQVGRSWPGAVAEKNPARLFSLGLGGGPIWFSVRQSDFDALRNSVGVRVLRSEGYWLRPFARVMSILPRARLQFELDLGYRWAVGRAWSLAEGVDGGGLHPSALQTYQGQPAMPWHHGVDMVLRFRFGKLPFIQHGSPLPPALPSSTIAPDSKP